MSLSANAGPLVVLLLDDDPDAVLLMRYALNTDPDIRVETFDDPYDALRLLDNQPCDVVVTDIELPGMNGLEVIGHVRQRQPGVPVVVVTGHASVDYAVEALRNQADEFLTKPLDPNQFVETVRTVGDAARQRARADRRVVLAVGAHPDDVEIGVGGLLSAHHARGDDIAVMTLTSGGRGGDRSEREVESRTSADLLGARLFLTDLGDTEVAVGDPTVSSIHDVIAEIGPDTVYTHSVHDLHQDHRAVHQATLVAARTVPTVACYQSPSATVEFSPNRFAGIDAFMDRKLKLLNLFVSQVASRDYLEPDVIVATARYWSRFGGGRMAEPLEVIRDRIGFPDTENGAEL